MMRHRSLAGGYGWNGWRAPVAAHVWHVDGNAQDPTEWRNNLYLFAQRFSADLRAGEREPRNPFRSEVHRRLARDAAPSSVSQAVFSTHG